MVLCTPTHTYDVKEAETSNSLLLLPDLSFPQDIQEVRNQTKYRTYLPLNKQRIVQNQVIALVDDCSHKHHCAVYSVKMGIREGHHCIEKLELERVGLNPL